MRWNYRNPACGIAGMLILLPRVGLAQSVPRAEVPQPQFQRDQWVSLNGRWDFEFDDANEGEKSNWQSDTKKFSRSITVPYCFESKLSGIGDTGFHPRAWYRRSFTVPANWKGKNVVLRFGAVDYRATVWVNGNLVGNHEGGNTPFWFDISHLLHSGSNVVVVRAEDPPTDRSIPRGKQYWEPKSRGIFYTRTSGICQSVWLEIVHPVHLEQVRITPSVDGTVRFDATIVNAAAGLSFHAEVTADGKTVAEGSASAHESSAFAALQVPDPKLWTPNSPNLYDVTFELRRGNEVVDRVHSYFGLRTIRVQNGRVLLNGRPTYLKMVLAQGYWPQSILTPPLGRSHSIRYQDNQGDGLPWGSKTPEAGRSTIPVLGRQNGPTGFERDG
jgi:beta-galactosidase/beta-glucuronidase